MIPSRLIELISERRIVPFIGAGFSIPSGVPSWNEITNMLVARLSSKEQKIFIESQNSLNEFDVAELIESLNISSQPLFEYISEQINNVKIQPSEYHHLLSKLSFDTIITTNWDTLLETFFSNQKTPNNVIYRNEDIGYYLPNKKIQILKIHGTINDYNSLVFKKSHYERFWEKNNLLFALLTVLMSTRSFLFIGYGMGDPNIVRLITMLKEQLGINFRDHYALVYGDEKMSLFWKRLGIQPIHASSYNTYSNNYFEDTNNFLISLGEYSQSKGFTNLERSKMVNREINSLISKRPVMPTLYMRGSLGWLSNPLPDLSNPVYGSYEQDIEERKMTELIIDFLTQNKNNIVKNILNFNTEGLLRDFTSENIIKRLKSISEIINRFPTQVQIVHDPTTRNYNQMIFNTNSFLVGYKRQDVLGIQKISISTDNVAVRNEIEHFEVDYNELTEINFELSKDKQLDTKNKNWLQNFILKLIEEQIEIHEIIVDESLYNNRFTSDAILFSECLMYAIEKHESFNQKRDDLATPYYIHLLRVIERLRTVGNIHDYSILSAAALHDVIEDCEVKASELELRFGEKITRTVVELSKLPNDTDSDYISQIKISSINAKIIKLADKWDNVYELNVMKYEKFGGYSPSAYIEDAEKIMNVCKVANLNLYKSLFFEIENIKINLYNTIQGQ